MNFQNYCSIYVPIDTVNGPRYLTYEPKDEDRGIIGSYIRFGLGSGANDGTWRKFTRNIENDLHQFEPDNSLIAINALLVRGDGMIDDIKTIFQYERHIYEDAEDGNIDGWRIMSGGSGNGKITNIEDENRSSRVISLKGEGKTSMSTIFTVKHLE